jgi:RNA polymerase sigma factor (sigma-70 family)
MARAQLGALLQHLRRMVGPRAGGLTDADLLERFVSDGDEAAFEVLVWRHGPMVQSVCRRVLRQEQDAEDAIQATFLTLVRKARSIAKRQSVASWLYKVAYRIALEAKTLASKRQKREKPGAETRPATVAEQPADAAAWRDLQRILDEEINRLPEKYRTPVILCYFEGKTYEEAAREIGCPKGTVSIRLMRAREFLRPRLSRRGLAISAGMLATALSENATAASISTSLVEGTVKAAVLFAAGKTAAGILSGQAVALTEGVLKTMFVTKLRFAAALVIMAAAGTGAGVGTYGAMTGEQPPAQKAPTPTAKESNEQPVRPPVTKAGLQLEAAQLNYQDAEADYEQRERQWTRELVAARLRAMEAEDRLKIIERDRDHSSQSDLSTQLKQSQVELSFNERTYTNKDDPRLTQLRKRILQLQEQLQSISERRDSDLAQARKEYVKADEELRLLERLQTIQRERAQRNLAAADDQIRKMKGASIQTEPAARGSVDLEIKVDRLLREIGDLRREIRRQAMEKSQQRPGEHRPDQR